MPSHLKHSDVVQAHSSIETMKSPNLKQANKIGIILSELVDLQKNWISQQLPNGTCSRN